MKRPEILAPAGSMDAFRAAVHAGADAVYVGGDKFGARAYANNFNTQELVEAIEYAHLYDCNVYLTLNTLVKEKEFHELYEYVSPFYEAGLDAVLIQDMGVACYIQRQFPLLPIHASTQMTITGVSGARHLKNFGATRIVPARELSLEEIKVIKQQVDIEVETFVHGAICYCYSGQCLMSSLLGGRSGNRGRCAQPCRLPYELYRGKERISRMENPYLLSPKDMCTIENIPELVQAGIDSFKIEGRMKNPVYVASVVSLYRKYLDRYLEHPEKEFQVSREDLLALMDTFNRGGFSQGYYHVHNGKDLMAERKTGHQGVLLGTVQEVQGANISIKLLVDMNKGDRLEVATGKGEPIVLTSPESCAKGTVAALKGHHLKQIKKGQEVYRTSNQGLTDSITEQYILQARKLPVQIVGTFLIGRPAEIVIQRGEYQIQAEGDMVEKAAKTPITAEQIQKQLKKTGNTIYQVTDCSLTVDEHAFLPMKSIKELRRRGLAMLEEIIRNQHQRSYVPKVFQAKKNDMITKTENQERPELSVSIFHTRYFSMLLEKQEVSRINIDYALYDMEQWKYVIQKVHARQKKIYCIFPRILRNDMYQRMNAVSDQWMELDFDGIVVGSIDTFAYVRDELGWQRDIACDYTLYQYNQSAVDYFDTASVLPVELNKQELCQLQHSEAEMLLYGYLPLMVSAGCSKKNALGCDKQEEILWMQDRYHKKFPVVNRCNYCYNVVYNSEPVYYLDIFQEIQSLQCQGYQIHFTIEDTEQAERIINDVIQVCCYGRQPDYKPAQFTRGHWKRGIE